MGRTQTSAPFSPAGRRVSTQFYFRIRLLDFREFMGLGLLVMYPFPSSSGGLGGTFYTGCSPISCRNKLKTCLTKIRETPLQKQMLRFCANRTFYLQPFLPIAKPYLIFCFISLHGGKFSSEWCKDRSVYWGCYDFLSFKLTSVVYGIPGPFFKEFFVCESSSTENVNLRGL